MPLKKITKPSPAKKVAIKEVIEIISSEDDLPSQVSLPSAPVTPVKTSKGSATGRLVKKTKVHADPASLLDQLKALEPSALAALIQNIGGNTILSDNASGGEAEDDACSSIVPEVEVLGPRLRIKTSKQLALEQLSTKQGSKAEKIGNLLPSPMPVAKGLLLGKSPDNRSERSALHDFIDEAEEVDGQEDEEGGEVEGEEEDLEAEDKEAEDLEDEDGDEDGVADEHDLEAEVVVSEPVVAKKECLDSTLVPVGTSASNNEFAVMRDCDQDEHLRTSGHYDNLPPLHTLCDVAPFDVSGSAGQIDFQRIFFSNMKSIYSKETMALALTSLRFTNAGDFFNTARVDPSLLYAGEDRILKVAGTKRLAICVMQGALRECHVVSSTTGGPLTNISNIHKVTITPHSQEIRRDFSFWGAKCDFQLANGTVNEQGISFCTKMENARPVANTLSAPPSPQVKLASANDDIFSIVKSPVRPTRFTSAYSLKREFTDAVPIYDGRKSANFKAFEFTEAAFQNLAKRPLYKGGKSDLPPMSLVAVGYTLSTYIGKRGSVIVNTNLQFLILLGLKKSCATKMVG